jgi:hypothetical protein
METYREVKLSELITQDGYVVAIEGDNDLYDNDLAKWLKDNVKNYILLNNIYDDPQKLMDLKNIKINAFIFQTTGLNPKINELIDMYIKNVANYPKHFISVFKDKEDVFWKVFQQIEEYEVYHYNEVDDNELYMTRQDHSCSKK